MENLQKKLGLTDAQLAEEILKRKLLSAGRLRAALDYQASVGGHLIGVLQKLGLVKENDLQVFMAKLAAGEDFVWSSETEKSPIPCPVEVSRLRVHRKLLEKIPPELVDRYNLLLFFPPPGYRAILMASDPIVKVEGVKKLQALLCVEICPIQLSAEEMAPFLAERQTERASSAAATNDGATAEPAPGAGASAAGSSSESGGAQGADLQEEEKGAGPEEKTAAGKGPDGTSAAEPAKKRRKSEERRGESGVSGSSEEAEAGGSAPARSSTRELSGSDLLLQALASLLVKKELINSDELKVEIELVRRRSLSESSKHHQPRKQLETA